MAASARRLDLLIVNGRLKMWTYKLSIAAHGLCLAKTSCEGLTRMRKKSLTWRRTIWGTTNGRATARRARRAHRLLQPLNQKMRCKPRLSIAAINRSTQSCGRSRHRGNSEQHATIPGQRVVIPNERIHQRTNILDLRTNHRRPHPLDRTDRMSRVLHRRTQSILAPVLSRWCRYGRRRSPSRFLFHRELGLLVSPTGMQFLQDVKFNLHPAFFRKRLFGYAHWGPFFHHRKQGAKDASNPLDQHSPDGFPRLLDC